jgi:type III secretion protein V
MVKRVKSRGIGLLTSLFARDLRGLFGRYSDIVLATLVASMVGMLIVPLPGFLLDLAIALNLGFAVTLLLLAIYVGDALKIATFPSLLLLTTLFRLAIEVSATRLILLKASAGQIIHAFGSYVVAGNIVVGVVVFVILTTIQYVVIAKGAGRVAEVSARFTLDAMPGKQMAIDAELRAGHIDRNQARAQRALLARESQFFGSMDGAMKFVKGDAIAGILVLVVNIVGGMLIGVLQRGMDIASAARTYTLLTIGGGLVAQIPALVISSASGILVTRVSSDEEYGHLGSDIGRQILAQPKALAVAAFLLVLLGLVPGLPALPLLMLGALAGLAARTAMHRSSKAGGAPDNADTPSALPAPPLLVPLALALSTRARELLRVSAGGDPLSSDAVRTIRSKVFHATGIPIPDLVVRVDPSIASSADYVLEIQEVAVAQGSLAEERVRAQAGAVERVITDDLIALLCTHGYQFVGIQETQQLLDGLSRTHPDLVREVAPKQVSLAVLAELLQRLAREGVSLRTLPDIMTAVARCPGVERTVGQLVEWVRASLRRQMTCKYRNADGSLDVFFLDTMIEETVREAIRKSEAGHYLALEPALRQDIVQAVGQAVADVPVPIILTTSEIRPHVRALIEAEQPQVAVLAYTEILPEAKLANRGRIAIAG